MKGLEAGPRIKVFDTTLRDGEQTVGANFTVKDKVDIATFLSKMGVDIVEAGFPMSNGDSHEGTVAVAEAVSGIVVCGLSRASESEVSGTWDAIKPAVLRGGARIHTFAPTSEIHMNAKRIDGKPMTRNSVKRRTEESVAAARELTRDYPNADVEFSAEDATRSDPRFLMDVLLRAVAAGATTINVPDTAGATNPWDYGKLIGKVKRRIDREFGEGLVTVSAHCHDDLGRAAINSEAALRAGATQFEATINSIGERGGNAPLEEIVAAIFVDGGYTRSEDGEYHSVRLPNFHPRMLKEASRLVAQRSGIIVPRNKAVVGANATAHEAGIHTQAILRDPKTYENYPADMFGGKTELVMGKLSGNAALGDKARELGYDVEKEELLSLGKIYKDYAVQTGRIVTHTEIEKLIADSRGEELVDRFKLVHVHTEGSDEDASAEITMLIDGIEQTVSANGNEGQIAAGVQAINQITGLNVDLIDFSVQPTEVGASATGGIRLTVVNGMEVSAYAEDRNIIKAAIKAYVAGVNTLERAKQRKEQAEGNNSIDVFVAERSSDEAVTTATF